jgi:hypothetical protein
VVKGRARTKAEAKESMLISFGWIKERDRREWNLEAQEPLQHESQRKKRGANGG